MKWWSGLDVWNDSLFEKLVTDWGLLRRRVLWTLWSICACTFVIINVSLKSKFSYCAQFISACYSIYIYIYIPCSASKMTFLFCCIMNQSYLTPYLTTFFFLSNSKSHPTLFSHWISSFTLKNNVCQTTESKTYRIRQPFLYIALGIKVSWNPKINFIWVMCGEHHKQCYHPLILIVGEN